MPTLFWCPVENNWFKTPCAKSPEDYPSNERGVQWSTFVNNTAFEDLPERFVECKCSIKLRESMKPQKRRLP